MEEEAAAAHGDCARALCLRARCSWAACVKETIALSPGTSDFGGNARLPRWPLLSLLMRCSIFSEMHFTKQEIQR